MQLWKLLFSGKHLRRENSTCPTHQAVIFLHTTRTTFVVLRYVQLTLNLPVSQFSHLRKGISAEAAGQGQSSTGSPDPAYSPRPGVCEGDTVPSALQGAWHSPIAPLFYGAREKKFGCGRDYDIRPQEGLRNRNSSLFYPLRCQRIVSAYKYLLPLLLSVGVFM